MDSDPLHFKQFGDRNYKILMGLLIATASSLILSLLFFMITLASPHDTEVQTVNRAIAQWNTESMADELRNISLKMKVMPSQGHGVVEFMNLTTAEDPKFEQDLEKALGTEVNEFNVTYFLYSGDTSYKFSTLSINDDMVPVGDAQAKCFYIEWGPSNFKNRPGEFKPVANLPNCSYAQQGWWNDHDPIVGVDISNWYQDDLQIVCSGKKCVDVCRDNGGWWVWNYDKSEGKCFVYTILETICIKIRKYVDQFGRDMWAYAGGCFKNNEAGKYMKGKPGQTYKFENVKIEVRGYSDPYISAVSVTNNDAQFSTSTKPLSIIALTFFFVFLMSLAGFVLFYFQAKRGVAYREQSDVA